MSFLLTIDAGTTSMKISLLDTDFNLLHQASVEYGFNTKGNRGEMDPETYWQALTAGINELHDKDCDLNQVAGICITTQGETLIAVNEHGDPLYPAIIWLDGRAEKQARELRRLISAEDFYRTTGVPECNGFCPVSKLLWFKQEARQVYERASHFLLLEDYLHFRLTGRFVTEKSILSTTGYFNLEKDVIWDEFLDRAGLDKRKIPAALECGTVVGALTMEAAEQLGLPSNAVTVTGAMDQVCGAIGAGNISHGCVTETTGTALCIGATIRTAAISKPYGIPVYRHFSKDVQLWLSVSMTAGMAFKWFRDTFCEKESEIAKRENRDVYDLLTQLAEQSPPLSGGLTMLPYLSGSLQPVNDPELRGSFSGIGLHTTKADFVRSILEGVGYMLKENLNMLAGVLAGPITEVISMGGGSKSRLWCQIKADICDVAIRVSPQSETASLGAAMLCATALGFEKNLTTAARKLAEPREIHLPDPTRRDLYRSGYLTYLRLLDSATKPRR